jgi:hypothetical protein
MGAYTAIEAKIFGFGRQNQLSLASDAVLRENDCSIYVDT